LIGGTSWLSPTFRRNDGEELFMLAEVRWPASGTRSRLDAGCAVLGTVRGSTVRKIENGALFVGDARQETGGDVPGAVPSSRAAVDACSTSAPGSLMAAFLVPLPHIHGRPIVSGARLPSARTTALPDQFTYRFKVIRKSEPMRTETIGPFAVDTIVTATW
jgi:hypothetical protein